MKVGDFHGFHFLPPSIRVPPAWFPGHATVPVLATADLIGVVWPVASSGAVLLHDAAADHVLPLGLSFT